MPGTFGGSGVWHCGPYREAMFTGIVRELGRVAGIDGGEAGVRLRIAAPQTAAPASRSATPSRSAASASRSSRSTASELAFDAVPETMTRTALGRLAAGDDVNVEPALRAGEPLGGHVVQGHVDGVGRVRSVEPEGDGRRIWIDAAAGHAPLLRREGLGRRRRRLAHRRRRSTTHGFAVALIPHTLAETTLGALAPGDDGQPRGRRAREVRRATAPLYDASMSAIARRHSPPSRRRSRTSAQGKMVVVVDAADRENEGDLTIAAQFATPEAVNFMAKDGARPRSASA